MQKNNTIMPPKARDKAEDIRQEPFAEWWARTRQENDCDGKRRRSRETAEKHRLL